MADEPQPEAVPAGFIKNPQGKYLRRGQKVMAYNVYKQILKTGENSKSQCVKLTALQVGIGQSTVWKIVGEMDKEGTVKSPNKKRNRKSLYGDLDEDQKKAIRRIVHTFFRNNEPPTTDKVFRAITENEALPPLSRSSVWRILKKLGFVFEKRGRNHMLIEKPEIVLWRRRYLDKIKFFRQEGRNIYYLDETWVNAGHTKAKVWKDKTIKNARQAFIDELSVGLKDPSGKGKRFIISHIGSKTGFVKYGLLLFESKKTGDYHEDMNSEVFENWLEAVLPLLEPGCVIVMDNAPYHSRKASKTPNNSWKKEDLISWLATKGITVLDTLLKLEIMELVKVEVRKSPIPYVVDEMIEATGRIVLRLPPYHCRLNPIELIWAQVKGFVASRNNSFKLPDVKKLFLEGLATITAKNWEDCVNHAIEEENIMYELDNTVENIVERFVISANTGLSSESERLDSSSDDDPMPL